ncbi:ABC transporter ATP-binding protein [Nocardioides marmoriginsengisoli]|uniref:ABC transporter ATP-binding protein n=1 Tax=Nocardioides marmoriginsengisoli TaxID=661483 RepID=A0A3N0CAY4_9ACTN|nr:CocE/NonD family hydrolase [Nocardioides marmoriginsengisoli]RNL60610.1 ABC transporter ATP-binding protein [Nocardioides marmoriginsengisoli]
MRFSPRSIAPLVALALAAGALATAGLSTPASAAAKYTVTPLHFKVKVGPGAKKTCDIVGDLYLPAGVSSRKRVPAILATNGFGGSKADQAGIGKAFSQRGYAVLSYSGLGFGGSGCQITLDDPDWDGVAGRQLISYLGGARGIAFKDAKHTKPAPVLTVIRRDAKAHNGKRLANDPRVGMVGGSYGGQIQFAIASVDPRLDAIVPIITWSDLSYSLGPNNTTQVSGVRTSTPGATKLTWGLGFTALGIINGLNNAAVDPTRFLPCPNFASFVCAALVQAGTLGYFDAGSTAKLRHASASSYLPKIKIPTLLIQGEGDTLFNLNEGIANYRGLQAQGTEVKMIWQSWGHSDSSPAPGEIDLSRPNPATQYETGRISAWFERYLKGRKVGTGPEFAYFRDWVKYSGNASPAYATSASFPVGSTRSYYLSGKGLTPSATGLVKGTQSLVTAPAGLPTNLTALDAISYFAKISVPEFDLPGTTAAWNSAALTSPVAVAGSPKLTLKVSAAAAEATQKLGPAGDLVLLIRMQDVAPDGKASDIKNLTAPVRIPDASKPFTVTMPAFVHRFAPGHRIRLVVAASSLNYRGGLGANLVTITSGSTAQVLRLPVVK